MYRYTTREVQPPFVRDEPTLLAYGAVTSYAFWLYAFGPALALLQHQLHFSYTVLGAYSALWSGGAALAGLTFPRLTRHLSRGPLLWCSALAITAGAALFTLPHSIAPTMAGAAAMGFAGTTLLTVAQAVLSDRHGRRRERALTEANVGASACAVLAPLLLGPLAGTSLGWRVTFAIPSLALAALFLRYRRRPLPAVPPAPERHDPVRLPAACWLFALLVAGGMALEFCLAYFGVGYLTTTGLSTTSATTAISSYYLGILVGRVGCAALMRRTGRSIALLHGSLAATTAGFLAFWLAGSPPLAVLGLFVCGLGIANLYPLSVALVLGAAPVGLEDKANARTQTLGGLLLIVAPYLLGALADSMGLRAAFSIELVLAGSCVLLLLAGRSAQRSARPQVA